MNVARVPLDGAWNSRRADAEGPQEWLPAQVPGCAQTDLMAAWKLEDPFWGTNETAIQWVGRARWAYRRRFEAPALAAGARAFLVFEGLDTFAEVLLNGTPVGTSDNMFIPWRFDVTGALAEGENELVVTFDSAEVRATALAAAYGNELAGGVRPFVRKAQCHFGWDWGPTIVTAGIWRPAWLEIVPRARLGAIDAWGEPTQGGAARLQVTAEAEGAALDGLTLEVVAKAPDGRTLVGRADVPFEKGRASASIPIKEAELWWPNGMGGQPLYHLRVRLLAGDAVLDERALRAGVRKLELVTDMDEWGRLFAFRVNGQLFFAKGANWIPADAFPARITSEQYRRLVADCAAANMNMLRVWGGGYYEDERFYDACDEFGILVWQDFMFACALYPGDEPVFAANVQREAEAAVKRLRRHTCLAIWAGNNENESGWFEWGWAKKHPHAWAGYERVYHDILPKAVAALDPRHPYIPSSPTSHEVGHPSDPATGDCHYWNVWHGQGDHRDYLKSHHRFISEFGFQSLPLMETLKTAIPADQMRLDSPAMLLHQKSGNGNEKIGRAVREWLGEAKDFPSLAYLSQVYQAMAVRHGVEHWRRSAPRTMGALYWQANDCWPVASWASLDFFGRWKALHHVAQRFFAPYLVSALAEGEAAKVWATADFGMPAAKAKLVLSAFGFDGRLVRKDSKDLALEPGKTGEPMEIRWADFAGGGPVYAVAELRLGRKAVSRTLVLPMRPVEAPLADPKLSATVKKVRGGAAVEVGAENLAISVYLEAPGVSGRFEDNFFDLLPGETRTVKFLADGPMGAKEVQALGAALRVMSLFEARK